MNKVIRHQILRRMGLIETLCFIETNKHGWWFVKDGIVTFMLTSTNGKKRQQS